MYKTITSSIEDQSIAEISEQLANSFAAAADQSIINSLTQGTQSINNSYVYGQNSSYASSIKIPEPTSLSFDVNGETVIFEGQEILRLKQMLSSWIKENHPEDLL